MKRFIALILSIILLLSACSHTPSTPEETCRLYYFSSDSSGALHTLEEKIPDASQEDIIRDIYSKLCSPKSKKLVSMIPAGIKLESQSIAGGICAITLSEKYTELPEYTKSIVNTCLTKTFCSLTYIDRIIIMSGNESFELLLPHQAHTMTHIPLTSILPTKHLTLFVQTARLYSRPPAKPSNTQLSQSS